MDTSLDDKINADTAKFVALFNPKLADFGIMTAAIIDGEFVFVTEYPIREFFDVEELETAAFEYLAAGKIKNHLTAYHATQRAMQISTKRLLSITQLHNDVPAFVARFTTDKGLHSFTQDLIQHGDKSVGIIIKADGTIPRRAEARNLVALVSNPKKGGA